MKISMDTPSSLTASDMMNINTIAALGFGQDKTPDMLQDTIEHVSGADFIQRAYDDEKMVGFALYRRCLWRTSN